MEQDKGSKYVTWDVHHEFEKRIEAENQRRDDENTRQNKRLEALEATVKEISDLTASVKVLATNMQNMKDAQDNMSAKLDAIEQKPAKRWDTVITGVITGIVGALIGALLTGVVL